MRAIYASLTTVSIVLACTLTASAQSVTLAGSGYADPTGIRVAPSEITPLFVRLADGRSVAIDPAIIGLQ
jgi:hypothetical protein